MLLPANRIKHSKRFDRKIIADQRKKAEDGRKKEIGPKKLKLDRKFLRK